MQITKPNAGIQRMGEVEGLESRRAPGREAYKRSFGRKV